MYAIIKYIFNIHWYYNTLLYIRTSKNKKRVSQIKICGIICEYNPLHNGHIYQLQYARKKSDFVVCIMSGHFVQRGECAVFDKFSRAKAALLSGQCHPVEVRACKWVWKGFSKLRRERTCGTFVSRCKALGYFAGCVLRDILKI